MVLTPTGNGITSIVDKGGTSLSVVSEITEDRGVLRRLQRTLKDARINTFRPKNRSIFTPNKT